ncbi:MAG TPA: hypothetical protein VFP32_01400 [Candidatus Saccharimonadales bacterium]|nr:hypothetical protein [Candidatus Saccharimonadales bacterium]
MMPRRAAGGNPASTAAVNEVIERAKRFARQKDWKQARSELLLCALGAVSNEDGGRAHAYLAQAEYMLGDLPRAKRYAQMAIDLLPADRKEYWPAVDMADDVLHEIDWNCRHPNPWPYQLLLHWLGNWLHGRHRLSRAL